MNSLIDSLRLIPSVGKMTVFGEQRDQISIYLNSDKLSHYGIGYQLIAMQLTEKGFVTTAGRVKDKGYKSPIYVDHALNKIYDVENTLIYTDGKGNNVRLKDVAEVKREYTTVRSVSCSLWRSRRDRMCREWVRPSTRNWPTSKSTFLKT